MYSPISPMSIFTFSPRVYSSVVAETKSINNIIIKIDASASIMLTAPTFAMHFLFILPNFPVLYFILTAKGLFFLL